MSKKRSADVHLIPAKITVDDTAINEALRRFEAPYVLELHHVTINDDGEKVHTLEVTTWANSVFVWELLQWQLLGLCNLNAMFFIHRDEDDNDRYNIVAIEAQS